MQTDNPRKKSLIDALAGDATANTGMSGGMPVLGGEPVPADPSAAPPAAAVAPPAAPKDYSALGAFGFDPARANNAADVDGKYKFGRWMVDHGYVGGSTPYGADAVRAFVAANPEEWELRKGDGHDPLIRQKQAWLDNPANGDGKTGQRSIWQDVIGDAGPGGANRLGFSNVEGDPAQGFAPPSRGAAAPAIGGGSTISPLLQGDAQSGIQQALQNIGGLAKNTKLQQLIAALSGGQ